MWYLTGCADKTWSVVASTLNGSPQTCYIGSTFHFYADGKMIGKDKCSGLTNNDQFTLPTGSSLHITALPKAHTVSIDPSKQQATLTYPGGGHTFTLQYGNGSSSSCSGSASPSSKAYLMWYLTECTDRKWTVVSSTLNGAPQTCYIGSTFHFYADGKMIGKDKCSGLTNNDQFTLPSGSSVHITALPQAHAVSIDLALQQATLTYPGGDHFFTLQK